MEADFRRFLYQIWTVAMKKTDQKDHSDLKLALETIRSKGVGKISLIDDAVGIFKS